MLVQLLVGRGVEELISLGVAGFSSRGAASDPDALIAVPNIVGILGTLVTILRLIALMVSLPAIAAGFGLMAYRPWARMLDRRAVAAPPVQLPLRLGAGGLRVVGAAVERDARPLRATCCSGLSRRRGMEAAALGRARRGIRATAAPASHVAARRNAVGVVRMLLDRGAQARLTDARGEKPLHWAAAGDAATVATLLLDRGADVCAVARDGATALRRAALNNAVSVAPVLLDRGANVYASADDSSTPLHAAAAKDASGALRAFVDRGASAGSPPLRVAALVRGARSGHRGSRGQRRHSAGFGGRIGNRGLTRSLQARRGRSVWKPNAGGR